jgi:5-methylthioadenosine/S-adenosylhomocysteine deaminase
MTWRVSADWVLPVSAPPIARGAVLLDDAGRLLAVGSAAELPRRDGVRDEALPAGVLLLPGLVNTHSHLELTGFAGQVDEPDFQRWIARVIRVKAARSERDFFEAACRGIERMWAAGVTTVCDTGSTGMVLEALDHLGASGIAHHEVFGADPAVCDQAMRRFAADLDRLAHHATGRVGMGVSPHAPYTVSGALYRASCQLARAHGVPIAVHTAEPAGESSLLADFSGIFAEQFRREGTPRPSDDAVSPVGFMERHGVWGPRTLCIHAIHTDQADTELLARHGVAIAHCPRSNRFHHGADAPVARYRAHGLRIGLGTDSELSVEPPDLLAEAAAARRLAGWTAREAIHALTQGGADAIERGSEVGSLEPGKWGDMVALRVSDPTDPEEAVVAARRGDVVATWLAGREVYRRAG